MTLSSWRLYSCSRLIWTSKSESGIEPDPAQLARRSPTDPACWRVLMARNSSWNPWSSAKAVEFAQPVEFARPAVADAVGDDRRQPRVAGQQPAARRDAVGDGQELLRPELGEVLDHPGPQELGVELGDAVDACGCRRWRGWPCGVASRRPPGGSTSVRSASGSAANTSS